MKNLIITDLIKQKGFHLSEYMSKFEKLKEQLPSKEIFRNNSLKNYGLFPSHYLSTPTLSWDAMLNMRKVELELIPNPDM